MDEQVELLGQFTTVIVERVVILGSGLPTLNGYRIRQVWAAGGERREVMIARNEIPAVLAVLKADHDGYVQEAVLRDEVRRRTTRSQ